METVESSDGTRIAFERTGSGPVVVLVAGALTDRTAMGALAESLADELTVVNYDRRSRGDSTDAQNAFPDSSAGEIEDIEALAEAIGEPYSLYGHSSGAALALQAAARLKPEKLIVHEAPYDPDDPDQSASDPAEYNRELRAILDRGDQAGAVELFLRTVGMPQAMIDGMKESDEWADWVAKGRSLAYDSVAVGDATGGKIPRDLLSQITCPAVTLAGTETFPFMIEVAETLAAELPDAQCLLVEGADHEAGPDLIGPPIKAFIGGQPGGQSKGSAGHRAG